VKILHKESLLNAQQRSIVSLDSSVNEHPSTNDPGKVVLKWKYRTVTFRVSNNLQMLMAVQLPAPYLHKKFLLQGNVIISL